MDERHIEELTNFKITITLHGKPLPDEDDHLVNLGSLGSVPVGEIRTLVKGYEDFFNTTFCDSLIERNEIFLELVSKKIFSQGEDLVKGTSPIKEPTGFLNQ